MRVTPVRKTWGMEKPTQNVYAQELIGKNLKALRKAQQLTQEQLAEKATLHINYISAVERGLKNISIVNIEKLAKALGVTMTVLVDESDARPGAQ